MTTSGRIELMAPAGNFESMQAALDNGCDSIYFGVEQLNMRARATVNFVLDDLPEIARRCKEKKVRTYLTLNTIIYDHDLSIVKTLLTKAKEAGITAVIASDQAVIMTARTIGMEVHISTQLNVTNIETIKFYSLFADTMVLSRELSLRQVKNITDQIEICVDDDASKRFVKQREKDLISSIVYYRVVSMNGVIRFSEPGAKTNRFCVTFPLMKKEQPAVVNP